MFLQLDADADRLLEQGPPLRLVALGRAEPLDPLEAVPAQRLEHVDRLLVVVQLLVEGGHLDLDAEHRVAEGVEAHLVGEHERLPVVFQRVLGLHVDVGVVEGAAELGGDGLRVGFEVVDDVALVDVVYVHQHAHAEDDSGSVLGRKGGEWEGDKYKAEARVMEKGYSLKSLIAASRVEAFRFAGCNGERVCLFGSGRLTGSEGKLWRDEWHFGRSCIAERRVLVRKARGHALMNMLKVLELIRKRSNCLLKSSTIVICLAIRSLSVDAFADDPRPKIFGDQ